MNLTELKAKLKKIKEQGFIKTKRAHQGGAGNTLEQLLGIKENNLSLPDIGKYELKVKRENNPTPLSLFSKAPLPRGVNKKLFDVYHTTNKEDGVKRLYTTVSTRKNPQDFYLEIGRERLHLRNKNNIEAYWNIDELYKIAKTKVDNILLVIAKTKEQVADIGEEFCFSEAYLLSGITKKSFIDAIKNNDLIVDIRIGADLTGEKSRNLP